MKPSRRTDRVIEPPIVALTRRLASRPPHPDPIDLGQAVPDYAPPPPVQAALRASDEPARARYTPDPGLPHVRDAIAADLRSRHGAKIHPEQLLLTPGANAAFHILAHVFVDPGDRVQVVTPFYFNHAMSLELLGALVEAATETELDGDAPAVIVNPSNPTGRELGRAALDSLLDRLSCAVVDETYLEFAHEPATVLARDRWWERYAVVGTYSKSLSLCGHRIGYLAASEEMLDAALKVQDSAVVCAPHPAQEAVAAGLAWDGLPAWLDERRREIAARVEAFTSALAGDRFEVVDSGAFFAYLLDRNGANDADEVLRIASDRGVIMLPGTAFGPESAPHFRVAVGNATVDRLREAARRLSS